MRLHLYAVAATLLAASLAAHADDLFTFTGTNNSNVISFTLSSDPVPSAYNAGYFQLDNVAVDVDGTTTDEDLYFFTNPSGGGLNIDPLGLGGAAPQLFGGTTSAPTLSAAGPYTFNQPPGLPLAGGYSLVITDVSATPEPSSFILLGTGLLGVAGVVRRRFV